MKSIDNICESDYYNTTSRGTPLADLVCIRPKAEFHNWMEWEAAKEKAETLEDLVEVVRSDDLKLIRHPDEGAGFEACFGVKVFKGVDSEEAMYESYELPSVLKLAIDLEMHQPSLLLDIPLSQDLRDELPLRWHIVLAEFCQADIYMRVCHDNYEDRDIEEHIEGRFEYRTVPVASVGWGIN